MTTIRNTPASNDQHPALELRNVTKRFPGVIANDNASISVATGEVHGILGENGAGKSTLMRILYGAYQADSGSIYLNGERKVFLNQRQAIQCGIGMIHQEFMLVRQMSVVENVILGLDDEPAVPLQLGEAAKRIEELSTEHGLDIDPWSRVEDLPVGVQQRVEILKLLYRNATVLILDEPTAILTPPEAATLLKTLRKLASADRAVIIVTHKLHEIMSATDRVTIMRDGATVSVVNTVDTSEAELARLMVGRDITQSVSKSPCVIGLPALTVNNLHVKDEQGEVCVAGVDLTVHGGEIVGIAGVDGNGQSQLVEALMGLRAVAKGTITIGETDITNLPPMGHGEHGLLYVPADRRNVGAVTDLSIEDNSILGQQKGFAFGFGLFRDRRRSRKHADNLVSRFQVRTPHTRFAAGKLSGGNLQKLILGRQIMRGPEVLIVEQPTRGLDIGAIEYVWDELLAVRQRGKGILLVSAELNEIKNLSDRILVMHGGRIMGEMTPDQATDERIGLLMAGVEETAERSDTRAGQIS